VPAAIIRAVRIFHGFSRDQFAEVFQVSLRTVFRWESDGVDPASLQLDPGARSGPEWRRQYMFWLLERYEATGVSDTRKKEG
jgi:transcriptional regulator with XRE-family HTH domain